MTPIMMIPVEVVALLCVACFAVGMVAGVVAVDQLRRRHGVFAVDLLRRKRDLFAMHREQYEPIEHVNGEGGWWVCRTGARWPSTPAYMEWVPDNAAQSKTEALKRSGLPVVDVCSEDWEEWARSGPNADIDRNVERRLRERYDYPWR